MGNKVEVSLTTCVHARTVCVKRDCERGGKRWKDCVHTDLCGLDFVACAAAPSCEVWENLTLLTFHTRLHLTPPLLGYN